MKWINKKTVSAVFAVGLFLYASWYFSLNYFSYGISNLCEDFFSVFAWSCGSVVSSFFFLIIYILLPLLLPFLFTLPLKPSVFNAWKKFAVWVIPITFVATFALMFAPSGSGLGGFGGAFLLLLILILYGLYLLISLIIIAFAWWKSRKGSLS